MTEPDLKSFEGSFDELEELVRRLEGGGLTLDESLAHYERGVAALKRCYSILDAAEKRLEVLVREGDGSIGARPVDLAELRGEARGSARVAAQPAPIQPPGQSSTQPTHQPSHHTATQPASQVTTQPAPHSASPSPAPPAAEARPPMPAARPSPARASAESGERAAAAPAEKKAKNVAPTGGSLFA